MTELQQRIFDAATAALTELVDLDRPFFNPVRLLVVGGSSSEMAGGTIGHQSTYELGEALGVSSCAIAAIVDVRLAQAFVKTLGEPEKYASLLQELDVRVQRVEKRRAEEKAHRNNVRHGRK